MPAHRWVTRTSTDDEKREQTLKLRGNTCPSMRDKRNVFVQDKSCLSLGFQWWLYSTVKKVDTHLGVFVVGIDMAEHSQNKGSRFPCSWLRLSNQILWTIGNRKLDVRVVINMMDIRMLFRVKWFSKSNVFISLFKGHSRFSQHHR